MTKNTDQTASNSVTSVPKRLVVGLLIIGFLAGALWFTVTRYVLASESDETHYHANFAVYINGQREEFKEFTYYEEIAACSDDYANNPKGRVHMHDQVNDVIHVHDKRVTYGNFFQNIGWGVGDDYFSDIDTVYQTGNGKAVRYILNGEEVDNIANRIIESEDRLLVSFDEEAANFTEQFNSVSSTASEVNGKPDPASCSGLNGSGSNSFTNRLKRATFFD